MTDLNIPAGYYLSVSTYENDGDNSNSAHLYGLTKEETQFLVEFINLFKSSSLSTNQQTYYGNLYDPSDEEILAAQKAAYKVLSKYNNVLLEQNSKLAYNGLHEITALDFDIFDYLYDLSLSGSDFFTRCVYDYNVYYYKENLIIPNVTTEFMN